MASKEERRAEAQRARLAAEEAERKAAQRRRHIQVGAVGVFALAVVVAIIAVTQAGSGDDESSADHTATEVTKRFAGIPQEGTALGENNAPYKLIEVGDLQCPFCAQFATDVLPAVVDEYVRPGKLQLDLQLLTFIGEDSEEAARIALALTEQQRYWQFVDLFYANQGAENSGYVTEDFLRDLTDQIPGADFDEANAQANSPQVTQALDDASTLAQENGINSTPSFLIAAGNAKPEPFPLDSLDPGAFTDALDEYMATHG